MAQDVFISYSSKDKAVADSIVAALENNNIRCWCAPRDIKPGDDWGESIANAITASRVFLLIFSGNANRSQRVLDELNLAITRELTILPFRIEKLDPSGAMMLHLSTRHWLDAFLPSWEQHLEELVRTVALNLERETPAEGLRRLVPAAPARKKRTGWLMAVLIILAALAVGVVFGLPRLLKLTDTPAVTPTTTLPAETVPPACFAHARGSGAGERRESDHLDVCPIDRARFQRGERDGGIHRG